MLEEQYMRRAIRLAGLGLGQTNPNPMVGAVIVKNGRIIGEGYHRRCGGPHAERNALASCTEGPAGAVMYVTLEPCCHQGRTPPCTDAILENGIAHVVIGSRDPNPKAAGGAELLRRNGITVTEHFLQDECDAVNEIFFHYVTTGRPYAAMKYAMTADGKIASRTGASQWITSREAREHVHELRRQYTGILAGIGTVLADDPLLNCRAESQSSGQENRPLYGETEKQAREPENRPLNCRTKEQASVSDGQLSDWKTEEQTSALEDRLSESPRQPVRIICDSCLRIPTDSRICRTAGQYRTVIAYAHGTQKKRSALEALGITLLELPEENGRVSLPSLMDALGRMEIDSILLEGGGTLNEAMLRAGLVQKVYAYIAPLLLGGRDAKTPVEGIGFPTPGEGIRLSAPAVSSVGGDLLLEYRLCKFIKS